MDYAESLLELRETLLALAERIERFVTLEHVLNWLNADGYPLGRLDMVTQDEYSHDLLIPLRDSSDWLVFGIT
jgi:hypothetical protein